MKIKPLSDHIVIEPLKEEEKSKGGILLPQTAEKKPEKGKVVFVGPGKMSSSGKIVPMEVKVGDKVLFTKYGPNEIKIDNKEYLIATQDDILAVIE